MAQILKRIFKRSDNLRDKILSAIKEDPTLARSTHEDALHILNSYSRNEFFSAVRKGINVKRSLAGDLTISFGDFAELSAVNHHNFYEVNVLSIGNYYLRNSSLRNRGIGRLLFDRLLLEARKRKKKFIVWNCEPELVDLYKKWGAKVEHVVHDSINSDRRYYRMKYDL